MLPAFAATMVVAFAATLAAVAVATAAATVMTDSLQFLWIDISHLYYLAYKVQVLACKRMV